MIVQGLFKIGYMGTLLLLCLRLRFALSAWNGLATVRGAAVARVLAR